jgi:hypothetical protein
MKRKRKGIFLFSKKEKGKSAKGICGPLMVLLAFASEIFHRWIFFANVAPQDEHISTWWNQILCWLSYLNVIILTFAVLIPSINVPVQTRAINLPRGSGRAFWINVHKLRPILATIYVLACGIRGMWPRMDELRICFYDNTISIVAIGRSLATVAELSFCAQICLAVLTISENYLVANTLLVLNVIAQSCCWYSIITQDQRGHTVEESIWLISGFVWTVACFRFNVHADHLSKDAQTFRRRILVAGPLFVLFMGTVDVPMYYSRYQHDLASGREYKSFRTGFAETLTCSSVSHKDSLWLPEIPWMTLYFSFAVWTSIWLAGADIVALNGEKSQKKLS